MGVKSGPVANSFKGARLKVASLLAALVLVLAACGEGGTSTTQTQAIDANALSANNAPPDLAARLGLPAGAHGLAVTSVDPAGPAADAGLREGDLVEQANGKDVRSVEDLRSAVDQSAERPLLLLVNRGGQTIFVTVRPGR